MVAQVTSDPRGFDRLTYGSACLLLAGSLGRLALSDERVSACGLRKTARQSKGAVLLFPLSFSQEVLKACLSSFAITARGRVGGWRGGLHVMKLQILRNYFVVVSKAYLKTNIQTKKLHILDQGKKKRRELCLDPFNKTGASVAVKIALGFIRRSCQIQVQDEKLCVTHKIKNPLF